MPTVILGNLTDVNPNATVIGDAFFGSVIRANEGDNTIDLPGSVPSRGASQEQALTEAVEYLGVTSIRWPGGTEAEQGVDLQPGGPVFDWWDDTENSPNLNVADLHAVIDYCAGQGLDLSFTFPTAVFANGADVVAQAGGIADFIREDLLEYADAKGVTIASIKIGNEYNVQGMTATQYGEIARELSKVIGSEMAEYYEDGSGAPDPDAGPKLLIESGVFWLMGARNINDADPRTDTELIMAQFQGHDGQQYVDGVDMHSHSLHFGDLKFGDKEAGYAPKSINPYDAYFGKNTETGVSFDLNYAPDKVQDSIGYTALLQEINAFWGTGSYTEEGAFESSMASKDYGFSADLELHSLAWKSHDVSLDDAAMHMLHLFEMSLGGVKSAMHFLASGWGGKSDLYSESARASGEIFRLLKESLDGAKAVEFKADPSVYESLDPVVDTDGTVLDANVDDFVLRTFVKDGQAILYVANLEGATQSFELAQVYKMLGDAGLDTSEILNLRDTEKLHIWGTKLGVDDDGNPNADENAGQNSDAHIGDPKSPGPHEGKQRLEAHVRSGRTRGHADCFDLS